MVYGVGYSSGKSYSNLNNKCFMTWRNMLKRCYSNEQKYENYRKEGITVCDEWLDYEIFKKWFDRNYYKIGNEEMQLDKDILKHGNKIYCPEFCVFVPRVINMIFVRSKNRRGNLPIGVYEGKDGKIYSTCSVYGKNVTKIHSDVLSAFEEYKRLKEEYVKKIAFDYKEFIPENLYNAMMMFEVKISD